MRSALALSLGRAWIRWAVRRRMDGLFVEGLDHARTALARGPVLFAANHVSWWDGPLCALLDGHTGAESLFVVDAHNLRKIPFLRWFGCTELDRSSPLAMRRGLARTVDWLDAPSKAAWIFPQGRQRPAHLRPLGIERGVAWLARRSGATVVPVAIQYGWRESHQPSAALFFGPPCDGEVATLETNLNHQLEQIDQFFDGQRSITALMPGRDRRVQNGLGARLLTASVRKVS